MCSCALSHTLYLERLIVIENWTWGLESTVKGKIPSWTGICALFPEFPSKTLNKSTGLAKTAGIFCIGKLPISQALTLAIVAPLVFSNIDPVVRRIPLTTACSALTIEFYGIELNRSSIWKEYEWRLKKPRGNLNLAFINDVIPWWLTGGNWIAVNLVYNTNQLSIWTLNKAFFIWCFTLKKLPTKL